MKKGFIRMIPGMRDFSYHINLQRLGCYGMNDRLNGFLLSSNGSAIVYDTGQQNYLHVRDKILNAVSSYYSAVMVSWLLIKL